MEGFYQIVFLKRSFLLKSFSSPLFSTLLDSSFDDLEELYTFTRVKSLLWSLKQMVDLQY